MTEASQSQSVVKATIPTQERAETFSPVCASYGDFKSQFEEAEAKYYAAKKASGVDDGSSLGHQFRKNNLALSNQPYMDRLFLERLESFGVDRSPVEDATSQALGVTATEII